MSLPAATTLLHYMLGRFRRLVEDLVVRPERMAENIERGLGLHCSSRLLTTLVAAGLDRTEAYPLVQRNALRALDERLPFRQLVEADPGIVAVLGADQLARCFDDQVWLVHVRDVIARLERLDP